jgi:hypothetical protein
MSGLKYRCHQTWQSKISHFDDFPSWKRIWIDDQQKPKEIATSEWLGGLTIEGSFNVISPDQHPKGRTPKFSLNIGTGQVKLF